MRCGHSVIMGVDKWEGREEKRMRRRLWPEQEVVISQVQCVGKVRGGVGWERVGIGRHSLCVLVK